MPIHVIYKTRKVPVDSIDPSIHTLGHLKSYLLKHHEICSLSGISPADHAAEADNEGTDSKDPRNSKRKSSLATTPKELRRRELMKKMKLLCSGMVMANDSTLLSEYGVQPNSKIIMMFSPPPPSKPSSQQSIQPSVSGLAGKRKFHEGSAENVGDDTVLYHPISHVKRRQIGNSIIESVLDRCCILVECLIHDYYNASFENNDGNHAEGLLQVLMNLHELMVDSLSNNTSDADNNQSTENLLSEIMSCIQNVTDQKHILLADKPIIQLSDDNSREEQQKWEMKWYRYLNEKLMRLVLQLDSVETHGQQEMRMLRKQCVNTVNSILAFLDTIHNSRNNK